PTLNTQKSRTLKLEENFKGLAIVKAAAFKGREFFDVYISNGSATKQHAVLKLAEILGIKTNEMIGIGDHYNDFPLLMACGLKVAMEDSVEDLKAIADYVAPSVDEDGVADVIEKFVL
ncbi:MAG: HAD hydrolase family protein, partial [Patescibacteria group bacterium]